LVTEKEKREFQNGETKEVIVHDELLLKNMKHFFNIRNQNNQRNTEIQNVSYTLILQITSGKCPEKVKANILEHPKYK